MTKKRICSFIVLFILVMPALLFSQNHGNFKENKNLWDFLFSVKYFAVYFFAGFSLSILLIKRFSSNVRLLIMLLAFIIFGVLPIFFNYLFITPSPICAVTKPFLYGLKPQFMATLTAIGILSLLSVKGFCSTACPIGGLQELLYKIPFFKKFKIPFRISNSIRINLFILFLVVAFSFKTSSYYFINLFDLIHWNFFTPFWDLVEFMIFLVLILLASIFLFKPFCYFICPMGLFTWILEHLSFLKVRINKERCNDCGNCEKESPCASVYAIVHEKKIRGDCHLCGKCIISCKFGALYYGVPRNKV
jgi:polyferredoxin